MGEKTLMMMSCDLLLMTFKSCQFHFQPTS